MAEKLLVDSDVLIDFLRGRREAVDFLEEHAEDACISVLSVAELFAGVREGRERQMLEGFIASLKVFPLTTEIARIGGLYRRDYGKSHGVSLPDALMAATAQAEKLPLATLNQKHFPMLDGTIIPYLKTPQKS